LAGARIQGKAIQEANGQSHLPLRIGIHVGGVVVQGDDLMGDGVNVAARVEGIAEPGGIAITRAVHEQVHDKLALGFMDKGEIELKNIQRPVQVFVIGGTKVDRQAAALPLPDKPCVPLGSAALHATARGGRSRSSTTTATRPS
jgi:adenylate cyclase